MPTFAGRFHGGTTAQWEAHDEVLHYREMGIEYTVDGRILFKFGIKTEGDVGTPWSRLPYSSGPIGPSPEFEWDGPSIRFQQNNGTWGPWVNLQGPSVEYRWDGTKIQFKNPDGTWGDAVNLQGPQGEPGTSIPATSTSLGGIIPGAGFHIASEGVLSRDLLWSQGCDYPTCDWVVHNKIVYLWISPSGPGVAGVGPKEPGAAGSEAYWKEFSTVATGFVLPFAANSAPDGYILCNGAAVSRTTYADLFAVIGTIYGAGDGSTTFNIPNLMGRFIQGAATSGAYIVAGLPNITGHMYGLPQSTEAPHTAGSFVRSGWGSMYIAASNSSQLFKNGTTEFAADISSPIYGASATVQPPALTMRYYIRY